MRTKVTTEQLLQWLNERIVSPEKLYTREAAASAAYVFDCSIETIRGHIKKLASDEGPLIEVRGYGPSFLVPKADVDPVPGDPYRWRFKPSRERLGLGSTGFVDRR